MPAATSTQCRPVCQKALLDLFLVSRAEAGRCSEWFEEVERVRAIGCCSRETERDRADKDADIARDTDGLNDAETGEGKGDGPDQYESEKETGEEEGGEWCTAQR